MIKMTKTPLHPGIVLACILVEEDANSVPNLATALNMTTGDVHLLLDGQKDIDHNIAQSLMEYGYLVARVWLDMQRRYDLAMGRDKGSN
jgi:plasmid maintenance system antidote protein VapI